MSDDLLVRDINRYRKLRMHLNDQSYLENLQQLKIWQVNKMAATYATMLDDPSLSPLFGFFFEDIYGGVDLSELPKNLSGLGKLVQRFFSGTDMLFAALEFNALNGEIDQKLCEILFDEMQVENITTTEYVNACHQSGIIDDLHRRNRLLEHFADDLNRTVANKVIKKSVKWSKIPARAAGLGKLHGLIAKGFEVLAIVDDAEKPIARLIVHEKRIAENIQNKESDPFELL